MDKLTERERSVLELLCQGCRMKEIGHKLMTTLPSVSKTIKRAQFKYDAKTTQHMCYLHGVSRGTQL